VRATPVYHSRVKARASAPTHPIHHFLRGLDAEWCGELGPHRGDAVAVLRQTADRHTRGTAHGRQEGDAGTDSAIPAEQATFPPP